MKLKTILLLTFLVGFAQQGQACPTCASGLDDYTPPFFSEEFYKPYEDTMATQARAEGGERDEEEEEEPKSNIPAPSVAAE